ncbi:MAG TPA: aromatic-ring-hydroxylating dioxygenase subunit beta [Mycobacterium sp.]|nr:aromatic-ring-hydroxylating dioxygenase subunit beta [Mycobacterium sp.]
MTSTTNVSVASEVYDEVVQWIYAEAELLDAWKEREWLEEMVSKDIVYQVPLRQTIERARGNGFAQGAFHFDERFGSLETRVARNETEYAWAEDPPSRIRHHISNIRVAAGDQGFQVSSNLLIFRTHRDAIKPELLSARRDDLLRRDDHGRLRLLRRQVFLDATIINTHNMALFF